MSLEQWMHQPLPQARWPRAARSTMKQVVEQYLRVNVDVETKELLRLVDAAYPFGQRRNHPYAAWLKERRALIDVLKSVPPSQLESEVWTCATDLVEIGRIDEARRLLNEQAPSRLMRACPTCGVRLGKPCRDLTPDVIGEVVDGERINRSNRRAQFVVRVVPHETRMAVRRLTPATSGPLSDGGAP